MFRTGAQLIILTLLVGLFLMRESNRDPLRSLDERFADFLARYAKRSEKPAPITLVRIDETTLKEHPWPWSPVDFALFFQSASGFRPEIVATDEPLVWDRKKLAPDLAPKIVQYEQILREHVLRAARPLLGAQLGFPEDPDKLPPLQAVPLVRKIKGDLGAIPEFTVIETQAAEDFRLSSTIGFTNLPGDPPRHRAVPLLFRYRGQVVPSFVLQAAILWEKITIDDVSVELGEFIELGSRVKIPIDAAGRMQVDFGAVYSECSTDDLILAAEQRDARSDAAVSPELFAKKLILMSRTDPGVASLRLVHGQPGSRGQLLTSGIATILNRSFISRAGWWSDLLVVLALSAAGYWVLRGSKLLVAFVALMILITYALAALGIFSWKHVWLSLVVPAGQILFLVIFRFVSPTAWTRPPKPKKSEPPLL